MAYRKDGIPKVTIEGMKIGGKELAEEIADTILNGNFDLGIEKIAKDIAKRQDNAMAMEFTKYIGELLRKNGVVPKFSEYRMENHVENHAENKIEMRYGVSIDELDFTEHDKVFEDKIAKLEKKNKDLESCFTQREQDSTDMIMELKQRIAELESKESEKPMRIEFHADNGEMLTPLEIANSLITQNTFKVDELKELAEILEVYYRHHRDKNQDLDDLW